MGATIEGDEIVIRMKLMPFKEAPVSSTGKSKMLASTGGFIPVEGKAGLKFSVNVISPVVH